MPYSPISNGDHIHKWMQTLAETAPLASKRISGEKISQDIQNQVNKLVQSCRECKLEPRDINATLIGQLTKGHGQRKKILEFLKNKNERFSDNDLQFLKDVYQEAEKKLKHKPLFVWFRARELKEIKKAIEEHPQFRLTGDELVCCIKQASGKINFEEVGIAREACSNSDREALIKKIKLGALKGKIEMKGDTHLLFQTIKKLLQDYGVEKLSEEVWDAFGEMLRKIQANSQKNKMHESNIAIAIGPTFGHDRVLQLLQKN